MPEEAKSNSGRRTFAKTKKPEKYTEPVRSCIGKILSECPIPRDALPYTPAFQELKEELATETKREWSDLQFWEALCTIGKRGGLAGKGGRKKAPRTPSLTAEEQLEILRLMPDGIGNRDQYPYTPRFDKLHGKFTRHTGKRLTRHEFWRGFSRVAKLSRKPKPLFDAAPLGELSPEIVLFLERSNPWWRGHPQDPVERFRRWAFDEVLRRWGVGVAPAIVIRGPRRVGKSTIQRQLVEHLLFIKRVPPERIIRVHFDEVAGLGSLANPIEAIIRWYEDHVLCAPINAHARRGEDVYILFDELQDLPQWSPQLKAIVDHVEAKVLVTGSSALRIAREQNSLAGRLSTIELGPLRLFEIAGIRRLGELPRYQPRASLEDWTKRRFWLDLGRHAKDHAVVTRRAFAKFSELGGYPRGHDKKIDPAQFAGEVINTVVKRTLEHEPIDPAHRLDRHLLTEVFLRVCRWAGQSVRPKVIAQEISNVHGVAVTDNKVRHAIAFLVDAMLVHQVVPLELLQKKQSHPPKLCICDHFLRNARLQETVPIDPKVLASVPEAVATQAGHVIESIIGYFLMGIPDLELSWFPERKTEPEVDFVMTIGMRRIPVEVKYTRSPPGESELRGIRSFISKKHYNAKFGLVITQDTFKVIDEGIIALPASTLLLVR